MSTSLINVTQTLFDELVKMEYQSQGFKLRDTMRTRSGVIGSVVQFRKMGQVIAQPAAFQEQVALQDPNFTAYLANLQKYMAPTGVDEIEELTVNFDVKRELVRLVAAAIGRRSDQICINALNASGTTNNVPVTTGNGGSGNTNMNYAKFRAMVRFFETNAVPPQDRFIAMSGNNLAALLDDDQAISNRFTDNYAVYRGSLDFANMMGSNIRIIPDMPEGGLPLAGNIRTCFAWHRDSCGFALGQDMRVEINYLPDRTTWLINGLFYAGAVAIDNLGIITIACDESVDP